MQQSTFNCCKGSQLAHYRAQGGGSTNPHDGGVLPQTHRGRSAVPHRGRLSIADLRSLAVGCLRTLPGQSRLVLTCPRLYRKQRGASKIAYSVKSTLYIFSMVDTVYQNVYSVVDSVNHVLIER